MTPPEQRAGEATASVETEATYDDLFDLLSSSRRRFVIGHLRTRSRPAAVADVAAALTTWERDAGNGDVPKDEIVARYTALHHVHIPKMADGGVIEWNQERNTIALSERGDGILDEVSLPTVGATR